MSVAFYSDDLLIEKNISVPVDDQDDSHIENIDDLYEIHTCIKWIQENNFSKIALQFSDSLLSHAANVALQLEKATGKEIFILGDTSYGSCCVDEIAAEHASVDSIIHYGHACLSETRRLPVLYVFGKRNIDVEDTVGCFKKLFPDCASPVIIIYEVMYAHAVESIAENLKDYENLIISLLDVPIKEYTSSSMEENDNNVKVSRCRRYFSIPKTQNLNDFNIFYIGSQNQTLTNFMLSFNHNKFFTYNPLVKSAQPEILNVNKYLKKRYYYIEKTKDAKLIGILVGTLGVADYLSIIKHLREVIIEAGKKPYVLVVGKLNPAKLANFQEIEIFVNVACSESSVIDCSDFYQPIITPFELEIALNQDRKWTGDYVTDFSELLPGAAKHIPPSEITIYEADVSLITGKMRSSNSIDITNEKSTETSAVVRRDDMTVSAIHSEAAGEYLNERSWKGLEQCLGETPVGEIQQGRKGIACKYEDEKHNLDT